MTIQQALIVAQEQFVTVGIPSPWLDAEILLAFTLKQPREYLTAHATDQLSHRAIKQFDLCIARRTQKEPVAYITGMKEFYRLKFKVSPDVLIPRPATEELIEKTVQSISHFSPIIPTKKRGGNIASSDNSSLIPPPVAGCKTLLNPSAHNLTRRFTGYPTVVPTKKHFGINDNTIQPTSTLSLVAGCKTLRSQPEHGPRILRGRADEAERPDSLEAETRVLPTGNRKLIIDIGTGSGCIAITLAKHIPDAHILATDISEKALAVARENASAHGVADRITFLKGDLLDPIKSSIFHLPSSIFAIIANLPYVPTNVVNSRPELRFEPETALDGGPDGTLLYRRLLNQSAICNLQSAMSLIALEIEPIILNPLLASPELIPFAEHYTITHTPHTFLLTRKS